ncbi:30S ribosomal protein S21 [Rickettsiales endosymbiont of Paramecium tredecaurelia]|uniref:30S ribosomal protein S21 n=1 Tax=Candidatus Sarmatiella mevalonica TaxID=2770581 RepID=UPI00192264BC|nr:30S ribosomal protein S21 [Candidatus Sarmatiella mevalonica]MBL3285044.1 30S ribosomal protein S21 [Candidatus Sarmatiella mevalonica]
MVSINVRPGDNGTEALRKLRFSLAQEGYSAKLKDLRHNTPPSQKKREKERQKEKKVKRACKERQRIESA